MSANRIVVELYYKDLKQKRTTKDFRSVLKMRHAPITLMYKASALLLNMATCLYKGGRIGYYLEAEAPSLINYLTSDS